jgi:hypothetical protein
MLPAPPRIPDSLRAPSPERQIQAQRSRSPSPIPPPVMASTNSNPPGPLMQDTHAPAENRAPSPTDDYEMRDSAVPTITGIPYPDYDSRLQGYEHPQPPPRINDRSSAHPLSTIHNSPTEYREQQPLEFVPDPPAPASPLPGASLDDIDEALVRYVRHRLENEPGAVWTQFLRWRRSPPMVGTVFAMFKFVQTKNFELVGKKPFRSSNVKIEQVNPCRSNHESISPLTLLF